MPSQGLRIISAALAAVVLAAGTAGCGLGAGPGTGDVAMEVTEHFGAVTLGSVAAGQVPGSETVMRMLERHFRVSTRYGGGFVESIDGRSGTGSELDWFYYVNGAEASAGAATTVVHRSDRVWWDLHDWRAAESTPAVVGSFPEPFADGLGGRRMPTVLECAAAAARACARVAGALARYGVHAARRALGASAGSGALAVLVGPWSVLSGTGAAELIDRGPAASGVYARFSGPAGSALELLDPHGGAVRTLGAGAGLIAATAVQPRPPTWLITGTDLQGVQAAAAAMSPGRLHDAFALALTGGRALSLPLEPSL